MTLGQGLAAGLAAFCVGYMATRLIGLAKQGVHRVKMERARKARLEWFKRRD
jgi:hypothetical protein